MAIFCGQCGNEIKNGEMFCGNCGWKIPNTISNKTVNNQPSSARSSTFDVSSLNDSGKANKKLFVPHIIVSILALANVLFVPMYDTWGAYSPDIPTIILGSLFPEDLTVICGCSFGRLLSLSQVL